MLGLWAVGRSARDGALPRPVGGANVGTSFAPAAEASARPSLATRAPGNGIASRPDSAALRLPSSSRLKPRSILPPVSALSCGRLATVATGDDVSAAGAALGSSLKSNENSPEDGASGANGDIGLGAGAAGGGSGDAASSIRKGGRGAGALLRRGTGGGVRGLGGGVPRLGGGVPRLGGGVRRLGGGVRRLGGPFRSMVGIGGAPGGGPGGGPRLKVPKSSVDPGGMLRDSSNASPSGGVLEGTRSEADVGRLGPKDFSFATGKSPGRGTDSRETGKSPGRGTDSRETGKLLGRGLDSRETGKSLGRGLDSRETGKSPGRGTDSRETGKSLGRGTDSRATGKSLGRGTASRAAGRSSAPACAGGRILKVALQNTQTRSIPPLGMSPTICWPLRHLGQMTLSDGTGLASAPLYHRRAIVALVPSD